MIVQWLVMGVIPLFGGQTTHHNDPCCSSVLMCSIMSPEINMRNGNKRLSAVGLGEKSNFLPVAELPSQLGPDYVVRRESVE